MILGLCLIAMLGLGAVIAVTATRPSDPGTRERGAARRIRLVRRHPERVNLLDVENKLLADEIPKSTVKRMMRQAGSRRIGARTMWRFAAAHGSEKVVLAMDASLAEDTLLDHLDAGTEPDWPTVSDWATLNEHLLLPVMSADLTCPDDLSGWDFAAQPSIPDNGPTLFAPVRIWDNETGDGEAPKTS